MLNIEQNHEFMGHILVIDSGVGGLGVLDDIKNLLPNARYSYVADEAFFPYGILEKTLLNKRVSSIVKQIDSCNNVDCVVIACNTASTVVLEYLRNEFSMPIVGIVPAIKVAARKSKTKIFGVLATEATAKGIYIQTLIREFAADCDVRLIGSKHLARLAEDKLQNKIIPIADIKAEIAALFVGQGQLDQIVLGCTHYPFLLQELKQAVPYPVEWINPASSVAARVVNVVLQMTVDLQDKHDCYYSTKAYSHYKNITGIGFEYLKID